MRNLHTPPSRFGRALAAIEDLAAALELSDAERVELERRLLARRWAEDEQRDRVLERPS